MPGTIGKSIDIRVGPNFELHPLLETAMPLEKPKLGKIDLEIWQKALDFGKQKYDAFELSEKEKGVVALVIRQKRQAELQAKQQALNLAASAATTEEIETREESEKGGEEGEEASQTGKSKHGRWRWRKYENWGHDDVVGHEDHGGADGDVFHRHHQMMR